MIKWWRELTTNWSPEGRYAVISIAFAFAIIIIFALLLAIFGGWGIFVFVVFVLLAFLTFGILMSINES